MIERVVPIVNDLGLHARPAAKFVKIAARFEASVAVVKGDTEVNGKSILGMMMLVAEKGSQVRIRADGADAEGAIDALVALVADGFGEL